MLAGDIDKRGTLLRSNNDERYNTINITSPPSTISRITGKRLLEVRTLVCRGGHGIEDDGSLHESHPLQLMCRFSSSSFIPSQHYHVHHHGQRRWMSTIKRDDKGKDKGDNGDDNVRKDPLTGRDSMNLDQEQEQGTKKEPHWILSGLSKQTQNQIDAWVTQGQSLPNLITLGRIFSTPILCHWIINHEYKYAVAGCLVAGLSDYADGYIAKNYNQKTVLGTYLDPMADKILINSIALSLAHVDILPLWCAGLWLGRDVLLIGTGYRMNAIASRGKDHAVMDPSKTTMEVKPTMISKINTVLQFGTIALSLGMATTVPVAADFHTVQSTIDLGMLGHWNAVQGACYLTSCTTILSGLSYIDGKSMSKLKKK